jgi:hypothetical protein
MEPSPCRHCRAVVDAGDNFCRHCGSRLAPWRPGELVDVVAAPVQSDRQLVPRVSPVDNPWLMLFLLFVALGPGAIPMLWRGRAFSRRGKFLLTAAVILYTAFGIWLVWYLSVKWILEPLRQLHF